MSTCCPRCGFDLDNKRTLNMQRIEGESPDLPVITWNINNRFVTHRGKAIIFSPLRAKIFDKVWEKTQKNEYATITELVDAAYSGTADGGPEEAEASVKSTITKIRAHLQSIGLTITNANAIYAGYRLTKFDGDEYAMLESGLRARRYDSVSHYKPKTQEEAAVEAMDKPRYRNTLMGTAENKAT